jgi:hypothetical protein
MSAYPACPRRTFVWARCPARLFVGPEARVTLDMHQRCRYAGRGRVCL